MCRVSALGAMEPFYPLHVRVCERCLLVQLEEFVAPEDIFSEYAYFSSYSDSWVAHARDYVEMAVDRFGLSPDSLVVEVASNDGYLLQHVVERGIPALGSSRPPTWPTWPASAGSRRWWSSSAASSRRGWWPSGRRADLLVANNVMAHVPDLNDFVGGMKPLLAPQGVVTIEVPHLARLVEDNQFDTIYHEHFSYFSFLTRRAESCPRTASRCSTSTSCPPTADRCASTRSALGGPAADRPERRGAARTRACAGLRHARGPRRVLRAGRGDEVAPARVPDRSPPGGQARWPATAPRARATRFSTTAASARTCSTSRSTVTPTSRGSSSPARTSRSSHPEALEQARPDFILILPWNLKEEIVEQLSYTREWGARCVVPIPEVEVL